MTNPYPLPRETRETQVLVGDGVSSTFGPFSWKIFDIEDVKVLTKASGQSSWSETAVVVSKTTADAFAFFTVTFPAVLAITTEYIVLGSRLHERSTDLTKGGSISTNELEKEMSKQGVVLDELRRDADRSVRFPPGVTGTGLLPDPVGGAVIGWDAAGENLVNKQPVDVGVAGAAGAVIFGSDTVEQVQQFLNVVPGVDVQEHSDNLDELAGVGPGTVGKQLLAAEDLEDVDTILGGVAGMMTADELAATTVSAFRDIVQISGKTVPGDDNDGEPVMLVRSPGATVGFLPDAAATKFAYLSRRIKFGKMFHGANTGGVVSNHNAWAACVAELVAKGGGGIYIPAGQYAYSTQNLLDMFCNAEIEMHPDAMFAGLAGMTTSLMRFRGASGSGRGAYKWTFNNLRLDQSLGTIANQPSGLSPMNVREIEGNGGYFEAGGGWESAPTVGGDSGIEPINIADFKWKGGEFLNWNDAGIYIGGGNDQLAVDDGRRAIITEGFFSNCGQGITFKRAGNHLRVAGCWFELCAIGVTSSDVGIGQEVDTGQRMEVHNNDFKKITGRAIGIRSGTLADIRDNTIEDWGYNQAGNVLQAAPPTGRAAILFEGGIDSVVKDNIFRFKDWTENGHAGIMVKNWTDAESTVWPAGRISGAANDYACSLPVYELVTNVSASQHLGNRCTANVSFPALRNGSVFEFLSNGNTHRIYYIGDGSNVGVRTIEPRETFSATVTGTLFSSIGSLAAGTTSATVNVSVPGAQNGDIVILTPNSSAVLNSRLNYVARANTDQINAQFRNDHTAAIDFTTASWTALVIRRDQ